MWNPAPFELNSASAGAYYDLLTSGQGQLVSINQNNVVYVAWFTYDSAPAVGVPRPQAVGIPGQRWLTMLGTYQSGDTSVDLNVYAPNAVGVFNQPPVVGVDPVGTAVMDMESCTSGELRYTLDTGEAGTAVMGLLVGDNDQCEANYAGPAVLDE
jgi:hypothetical protein